MCATNVVRAPRRSKPAKWQQSVRFDDWVAITNDDDVGHRAVTVLMQNATQSTVDDSPAPSRREPIALAIARTLVIAGYYVVCESNPRLRSSGGFLGGIAEACVMIALGMLTWGVSKAIYRTPRS